MVVGGGSDEEIAVQLNLVPLIDILMNILFFLMIGFAAQELTYEGDLKLPSAGVDNEFDLTLSVTISRSALLVEETPVAKIVDGKLDAPMEDWKIVPLYEKLNSIRVARQKETGGIGETDDVVFLFADKEVPYTLLSPVMRTAALAGYPNFRLAVVKK